MRDNCQLLVDYHRSEEKLKEDELKQSANNQDTEKE
jgi:hypothetical protein